VTPTNAVAPFDTYPYLPILDPVRADPDPFFRVQVHVTDPPTLAGHFGCGYGLQEWGGIAPIRPAAWVQFEDRAPESLRWKLMAIRYVITWKNGALTREDELPPAERVSEGGGLKVYRLFEIPRRAWLVHQVQTAADRAAVYDALERPGFDPFARAVLQAPDSAPVETGSGTVEVIEDWPGHLALDVTSDTPALLIVSEAFHPGWAARVNGQPAPVLEADAYVQAVPVPSGSSRVSLDYRPASLIAGLVISSLAMIACARLTARGDR
jgi:hypothetical protein